MRQDRRSGFGIYVHIPFCRSKCPYCDFVSYAGREERIPAYCEALNREMEAAARGLSGARARTLYFGGGTPSLVEAGRIGAIIDACRTLFGLPMEAEVSLEANPGTVDARRLAALRSAGVNRLSLGVQSFHDVRLRLLGRAHTAAESLAAFGAARQAGFANVGLDLMYALPGQTPDEWLADLRQAVELGPEHVSLYGLAVEEGTPLAGLVAAGEVSVPSADEAAAMLEAAAAVLAGAGYSQYELSNWARHDGSRLFDWRCQHNLGYWRHEPYRGFGAGAHSYCGHRRLRNEPDLDRYVAMVAASGTAVVEVEEVDSLQAAHETVMLGLRLAEGLDLGAFAARHGLDLATRCASTLAELRELGLLAQEGNRVWLLPKGRLLANEVVVRLLLDLQAV